MVNLDTPMVNSDTPMVNSDTPMVNSDTPMVNHLSSSKFCLLNTSAMTTEFMRKYIEYFFCVVGKWEIFHFLLFDG